MLIIDLLKTINDSYASLISAVASILLMVITLIYVIITRRQVLISRQSVEEMQKQLNLAQQPTIIINNIDSHGTEVFNDRGRRQLIISLSLSNIGNAPALSIYVFSHFELQHSINERNGSNVVDMYFLPSHLTHIDNKGANEADIRYEEKEIERLLNDLSITYEKNIERLSYNPSQPPFKGTAIVFEVYYRNMLNQWFCYTYKTNIAWIIDNDAPKRKTHNINENTIPPKKLEDKTTFKLQMTSMLFSTSSHKTVTEDELKDKMSKYRSETDWTV